MTHSDERNVYADALLDVHACCADDGLSFAAEMTTLAAAWLHARRRLGRSGVITVDPPAPEDGERSPAWSLYTAVVTKPDPPAGPRPVASASDPGVMTAPRPSEVFCARRPPRYGPSLIVLYDFLRDGGPPMTLPPPQSTTVASLRSRCSTASSLCASHRLILQTEADHVTVTRVPRTPRQAGRSTT